MAVSYLSGWKKINNAWKIFFIILIVNILQAVLCPLMNDEPYYFVYAKYLDWGYYDHPPMIALLIKLGMLILPGEIGLRIFSIIAGSFGCYFIYRLIEGETSRPINFTLAALLIFSSIHINMYTFLPYPDTPLLCFEAIFLFCYRKYLKNDNLLNTALLGLVAALMLYSKYHGVLVIAFIILSNFGLFKKRSFYLVVVIIIALLSPLIYWQIQHNYPTLYFQLYERNKIIGVWEPVFLLKQLLVAGPVILILFSILYKTKDQFQKSLKFIVIGVFAFFFYSSFKGRINFNWTLIAWPPMICLTYLYIVELKKYRLCINSILAISLIVVIAIRLNFIFNFYKGYNNGMYPKELMTVIQKRSKGYPLVFENTYHYPSFYTFYLHKDVYEVNDMWFKRTQYNFLPQLEKNVQGKTVLYVSEHPISKLSEKLSVADEVDWYTTFVPNFTSFSDVDIVADNFKSLKQGNGNTIKLTIDSKLDSQSLQRFKQKGGYVALNLMSSDASNGDIYTYRYDKPVNLTGKTQVAFNVNPTIKKGHYRCSFSLMTKDRFFAAFNSHTYNIEIN